MRKKIYVMLCIATCLMFATACGNKKSGEELTTSAYNDTVSDMEKTTAASSDEKKTEHSSTKEKEETTTTSSSDTSTEKSSTKNSADTSTKTTSSKTTTEKGSKTTTTATEEEVITAEGDEDFEEPTTATKENEKESWATSGTLSGFIDNNSVEIILSDGSVKTFFVYDEKISEELQDLLESEEERTIDFISQPIAGQANSQIIELK